MTEQEDQYIHFASSIENLNYAWRILQEIKKSKNNSLVGVAFQFALIEYSKPYLKSYGVLLNKKGINIQYNLDTTYIPTSQLALHEKIIKLRNTILAHADLTVKEAKLHVDQIKSEKFVGIVQNVRFGAEELRNIDSIIELIEQTLDSMYVEEKRLQALLPLTTT